MKLFKVTYEKICDPSEGIFIKEYEGYYLCNSLDRLYNYIENEQHLTVKNIKILDCTVIESNTSSYLDKNKEQMKLLGSYNERTIIKAM